MGICSTQNADNHDYPRPDGTLLWCPWVMIQHSGTELFINKISLFSLSPPGFIPTLTWDHRCWMLFSRCFSFPTSSPQIPVTSVFLKAVIHLLFGLPFCSLPHLQFQHSSPHVSALCVSDVTRRRVGTQVMELEAEKRKRRRPKRRWIDWNQEDTEVALFVSKD